MAKQAKPFVNKANSGFTFLEFIVVIGILSVVGAFMLPFGISAIQRQNLGNITNELVSELSLSQQSAYSGKGDLQYGLEFYPQNFVLYTTPDGTNKTQVADIDIPDNVNLYQVNLNDAGQEITFTQGSLLPSTYGTLHLTDGTDTFIIEVSKEGLIDYYQLEQQE